MERPTLRRLFLAAFESEGLKYTGGGCQVVHSDLTWSISLMVDGTGTRAPYRLGLGVSLAQLGDLAPRNAEDCYLFLPLGYEGGDAIGSSVPRMPDAAFPAWGGTDDDRATAIGQCVGGAVRYVRQVDSLDELRARYALGDFDGALIIAPLRQLLDEAS